MLALMILSLFTPGLNYVALPERTIEDKREVTFLACFVIAVSRSVGLFTRKIMRFIMSVASKSAKCFSHVITYESSQRITISSTGRNILSGRTP